MPVNAPSPSPAELDALIRLLDDETPEVRQRVTERLALCGGDLSEWLASNSRKLTRQESALLQEMLRPGRRQPLEREWVMPSGGVAALREDWDLLEALLRALSDFLHDGLTLRQPLSDALDLLAEEATTAGISDENALRSFLFESGRLQGNRDNYHDPRNSDLAWSIAEGCSNPLGLGLIFILTARRLGLEVEGVNFPGHFLCRIHQDGFPIIIDCFDKGRLHLQATLVESGSDLDRAQRAAIRATADPGTILIRLLNNLSSALEGVAREDDAGLIDRLRGTLIG